MLLEVILCHRTDGERSFGAGSHFCHSSRLEAKMKLVSDFFRCSVLGMIFGWLEREMGLEFQEKMGYTNLENKMVRSETCTKGADIVPAARQRPPALLSSLFAGPDDSCA